ncbi:MAG: ComEC/Rec2 family competence protein, partial [Acidobacteriota bacterium]|nr:ComEC/Rec2 family competence protein [Acidobacteriota bacterium]
EGSIAVGEPIEITGVLEREPEVARQRLYLTLRVERIRVKGAEREASGVVALLATPSSSNRNELQRLELRYGVRIRAMTTLERSDNFRNPGVSSFTEYLDRKGYDAGGFLKSLLLIERLDDERILLPLAWLYEWRRKLQAEIDSRFSNDTAGVLDAALLGNRHNLSQTTSERFRDGGTFHVLVISGLHITFLGGCIFLVARRLTKNRLTQFLMSTVFLWGYALAVGAEPSVIRAALMFTVVLLAPLVSRRASSLNALGGVAIALLVWRPSDLFDPSFQLTFVSVLAIVLLAWPLLEKMSAIGSWRPTRETPYPPSCASWAKTLCESLFWSELQGQRELNRANYSYRLFKTPLAVILERMHCQSALRYAFAAVVVSFSVQLALLPFLVIYFHRLSLASVFLNIGVSAMMGGVALLAVASMALAQLSSALAAPLVSATNGLNWLMVHSVDPFARYGMASIRLPEYTGWASIIYALYYVPLGFLTRTLWRWKPLERPVTSKGSERFPLHARHPFSSLTVVLAQAGIISVIVFHPWSASRTEGRVRVDFLDVGQGDSALVTLPDNTTFLIDGGGQAGLGRSFVDNHEDPEELEVDTRSIGEAVVSEYLWWRGLDRVDYLVATHADSDHIDGLNDVARNFSVRAALVARTHVRDMEYSKFAETLRSRGVALRLVGAGDELQIGNVSISVLWPLPSQNPNAGSANNDSLVLRLRFGEQSILFAADIENQAENALLRLQQDVRANVVKVPHHGSKTSSTDAFISATRPRFAVVSVGQTSIFGHPNQQVVERWHAIGAEVLTTGRRGTITFSTNGRDLNLETFVK